MEQTMELQTAGMLVGVRVVQTEVTTVAWTVEQWDPKKVVTTVVWMADE